MPPSRSLPATEPHRWPPRKVCEARRASPEGPSCVCDLYHGAAGAYVLSEDGHATAYYLDRREAARPRCKGAGRESP